MIISIANQKGGVGKTVTSINLAAGLSLLKRKTLLIDMDPQGHSSISFLDEKFPEKDLFKVFRGELSPQEAIIESSEGVFVVPTTISLSKIERDLVTEIDGHFALKDILERVRDEYDYIIIDTPPALGMLTINCLVASEFIVIPVQASYLSLEGTDDLLDTISRVKQRLNPKLKILGSLVTIHDKRTVLAKDVVGRIGDLFGDQTFSTTISKSVRLEESPAYRESIFKYAPDSVSAEEYLSVCKEIIERVEAKRTS